MLSPDGSSELALAFHHTSTLFIFLPSPQFREFIDCQVLATLKETPGGEFTHKSKAPISCHLAQDFFFFFYHLVLGTMRKRG